MTDDEAVKVRGSWPLTQWSGDRPLWHVAGSNPPQYAEDAALEALWRAGQKPKPLTFISLFAGIGGIDLGLERAGMRCVAQVEIDDYASKILAKHWPDVARFRDIRYCGARNLPAADLIAGGFPCQDISTAGTKRGITGSKSSLWGEYRRIICELRPRYVFVENVANLTTRGLDTVLGDLAALRYDAEWHCIPAAAIGAAHLRDRLCLVAYAQSERRRAQPGSMGDCKDARIRTAQENGQVGGRASVGARLIVGNAPAREWAQHWQCEPAMDRVVDGIPRQLDRLRCLGNAVLPQWAEFVGRAIVAHYQEKAA